MTSPLKSRPLRNPGERLDRLIEDTVFDGVLIFVWAAAAIWLVAIFEWFQAFNVFTASPRTWTFLAIVLSAYATFRFRRTREEVRRLRLGRDGEKAVGQFLDRLRELGAQVFHDIPGTSFNVDHVVIHATGLYAIETKTRSKPPHGEPKLVYDGASIRKGSFEPESKPIVQARAAAKWLSELLAESTGRTYPARPVVVFPGWFIEPTAEAKSSDVWVLNPKALPSFIAHSAPRLSAEDVKLCAYHLSRYVRTAADA